MGGGPKGGPSKESSSGRVTSASRGVSMLGSHANCPPPLKLCLLALNPGPQLLYLWSGLENVRIL